MTQTNFVRQLNYFLKDLLIWVTKRELKNRTVASQNDIVLIGGHERKKTSDYIKKIRKVKVTQSCLTLSTPWPIQPMKLSRPDWSGQLFPSPGDLPNPGIKPRYPTLQVDSLPAQPQGNKYIKKKKKRFPRNQGEKKLLNF